MYFRIEIRIPVSYEFGADSEYEIRDANIVYHFPGNNGGSAGRVNRVISLNTPSPDMAADMTNRNNYSFLNSRHGSKLKFNHCSCLMNRIIGYGSGKL
jgi:hypothetical protein